MEQVYEFILFTHSEGMELKPQQEQDLNNGGHYMRDGRKNRCGFGE